MGAFNGNGVFVRTYSWTNDKNAGIDITASRFDTEDDGFATGLSTCITKDGQQTLIADIPWSGFKITGYGSSSTPSSRTDVPQLGQAQDGLLSWVVAGGTADAITAGYSPGLSSLSDGQECWFRATAANATSTPTFSPNGLPAHVITKQGGQALAVGDIPGNLAEVGLRYNLANTRWELLNPAISIADATNGGLSFSASTGAVTAKINPADPIAKTAPVAADLLLIGDSAAGNVVKRSTIAQMQGALSGSVRQVVHFETGLVATGVTPVTFSNAVPTNTEGDQYMSLAITPTNQNSILIIEAIGIFASNISGGVPTAMMLFQDSGTSALAVVAANNGGTNGRACLTMRHKMTAGTTSATTFKIRAGASAAGTTTFNGDSGSQEFGGAYASSITIWEILP